ncbi:MAG: hypothetical protein ACK5HS_02945 [Mycoplasmatales bacterium]
MRRIEVNHTPIRARFEELFSDLVFIVIISCISQRLMTSELGPCNILFSILLFVSLLFSWDYRLICNSNIHILSKKLNHKVADITYAIYFELLALILLLNFQGELNLLTFLIIFLIIFISTFINIVQIRSSFHHLFKRNDLDEIASLIGRSKAKQVNPYYMIERYTILLILFLGELIGMIYVHTENNITLIVYILLIIAVFNSFKNKNKSLKLKDITVEELKQVKMYIDKVLYLLLFIILYNDIAHNYNFIVNSVTVLIIILHIKTFKYKNS